MKPEKPHRVVVFPVNGKPEMKTLNDYRDMQREVGGLFDVMPISIEEHAGMNVRFALYFDDEGLLKVLTPNAWGLLFFDKLLMGNIVLSAINSEGESVDVPESVMSLIKSNLDKMYDARMTVIMEKEEGGP